MICSEDFCSAYQSALPADYLSKRAETKAVNTQTVGSGFFTGAKMAACYIKGKTKFQSGIHSIGYTVLIIQSTTSQHVNVLLTDPCGVFLPGVGNNSNYCLCNLFFCHRLEGVWFVFETEKT